MALVVTFVIIVVIFARFVIILVIIVIICVINIFAIIGIFVIFVVTFAIIGIFVIVVVVSIIALAIITTIGISISTITISAIATADGASYSQVGSWSSTLAMAWFCSPWRWAARLDRGSACFLPSPVLRRHLSGAGCWDAHTHQS